MSSVPKKPAVPPSKLLKRKQREREKVFGPLATEIGWVAYEWNRLQSALAELFNDVLETKSGAVGYSVWHSLKSDLSQREMLRAAANYHVVTDSEKKAFCETVVALLNKVNDLSRKRNDALHVPLIFVHTATGLEIETLAFFGSPQARNLDSKNLIEEFRWYRKSLAVLAGYAEELHYALRFPEHYPLRPIPALPALGEKDSPKRSTRRRKPKSVA